MSDMKKSLEPIQDLDFSDVSGGTESKAEEVTVAAEGTSVVTQTPEKPAKTTASDIFNKNAIYLPIPTGNNWVIKSIEDVSGEEFLTWVKSVLPMSENTIPEAATFEGKSGKDKKIRVFLNVAQKHESVLRRQLSNQKINMDKLKH